MRRLRRTQVRARTIQVPSPGPSTVWTRRRRAPIYQLSRTAEGAASPYLIQIDGLSQPVVSLLHRSSWATWRSASCMLTWATCACFVQRRKTLVVALLIALALSLIVPQSLIPWTTGILWGIALAIAWQWLTPKIRPVPARS